MTAHVTASRLYGHQWTTPEINAYFTDEGRTRSWMEILAALAESQAHLGLIPTTAATTIRTFVDEEVVDLDEVARLTRETGHSTLGLIRHLRARLPAHAREYICVAATVQDLTDTWMAVTLKAVGAVIARDLALIEARLVELTTTHRDTIMCGRTHGQPGLPITFGFKTAGWLTEVRRHRQRLAQGRPRWEVAQLGGALGTMEYFRDQGPGLLAELASRLGLATPDIPWLTTRDGLAEFCALTAMITGTLAKIGNEVYDLQRPEIGELREGATNGTVGSITMPHKRNPEAAEQLVTLSRVVRADAGLALEGVNSQHERDGRSWKTEWAIVPEVCACTAAATSLAHSLLQRLEVDENRMRANVDSCGGYLSSAEVMRLLAERHGKHAAHELVHAASVAGLERGDDFSTALGTAGLITDFQEWDRALDPRCALGATPTLIDRVLASEVG